PDERERRENEGVAGELRKRRPELRQEAREEHRHLRIAEVAREPLHERRRAVRAARADRRTTPRRPERFDSQPHEVGGADEPQREKRPDAMRSAARPGPRRSPPPRRAAPRR